MTFIATISARPLQRSTPSSAAAGNAIRASPKPMLRSTTTPTKRDQCALAEARLETKGKSRACKILRLSVYPLPICSRATERHAELHRQARRGGRAPHQRGEASAEGGPLTRSNQRRKKPHRLQPGITLCWSWRLNGLAARLAISPSRHP